MKVTLIDKSGNVVKTLEMHNPGYVVKIDEIVESRGRWLITDPPEMSPIRIREFYATAEPGVYKEA